MLVQHRLMATSNVDTQRQLVTVVHLKTTLNYCTLIAVGALFPAFNKLGKFTQSVTETRPHVRLTTPVHRKHILKSSTQYRGRKKLRTF